MLPRIFTALIAFFLAICSLAVFANNPFHTLTEVGNDPCPPAITPTNLVVTGIMPTSISVAWDGPDLYFYRVETKDETANITYPIKYVGHDKFATIDDLIPAHNHTIRVSASNCSEGPWCQPIHIGGIITGTIIVEEIVAAPCTTPLIYTEVTATTLCISKTTYDEEHHQFGSAYRMNIRKYNSNPNQPEVSEDLSIVYFDDSEDIPTVGFGHLNDDNHYNDKYTFILDETNDLDYAYLHYWDDESHTDYHVLTLQLIPEMETNEVTIYLLETESTDLFESKSCGECITELPGGGEGRIIKSHSGMVNSATPNPFSESTNLRYELTAPAQVSIQLFDAIGNLVQTVQPAEQLPKGEYTATIQGANLPNGTYFAVVQKGNEKQVFPLVRQE